MAGLIFIFFTATSLSKSNSVNNKNSLNKAMNNNGDNKQLLTNGNNSNIINNNETIKNTNNSKVRLYFFCKKPSTNCLSSSRFNFPKRLVA